MSHSPSSEGERNGSHGALWRMPICEKKAAYAQPQALPRVGHTLLVVTSVIAIVAIKGACGGIVSKVGSSSQTTIGPRAVMYTLSKHANF